mgnify:CR=1 FL=1
MKHTKGKWKLDRSGVATAIKSGDVFVASIYNRDKRIEGKRPSDNNAYDTSETDANANLLVLAPEMIEILQTIKARNGDTGGNTMTRISSIIDKVINGVGEMSMGYKVMSKLYELSHDKAEEQENE